jgi:hypothetical protein
MSEKKPALKAATPNDEESNSLTGDAAHDFLTERFTDPAQPNRVLALVVLRVTEAGGQDDGGARITKYRVDHIEAATTDADEKKLIDQLTRMHKGRTQNSSVAALADPVSDTPLEGVDVEMNDSMDDKA